MCLIIDSTKHKKLFGFYLPKIAWKDIPVYKTLSHYNSGKIKTPYQSHPVIFHKKKAVLRSILIPYNEEVSKGIHAYIKNTVSYPSHCKLHKAIIPKGSLYYIGKYDEIVSTKLIIFKD